MCGLAFSYHLTSQSDSCTHRRFRKVGTKTMILEIRDIKGFVGNTAW